MRKNAKSSSFHEYVMTDIFSEIPGITSRAMFGGWGIYRNGIFFALIADGRLYFKVSDLNRSDYERHGSKPFVYISPKGKMMTMSYWEIPEEIMENREMLLEWILKSCEVAESKRKTKKLTNRL